VIADLLHQRGSLSTQLPAALAKAEVKDQSLLQELCYGTARHYFSLDYALKQQLDKPLREKDSDIHALLLIGVYQLYHMRIPAYATINSCVSAADEFKKSWAKGLVNAVLRNIQRNIEKPKIALAPADDETVFDHPQWLIDKIRAAWPGRAEAVLQADNTRALMTLRINARQVTRDQYADGLREKNIFATAGKLASHALILETAMDVDQLPGFADGAVSIQDEAAQLSASLLRISAGLSVLDACAAPGGKTCHLLECEPSLAVTALDINKQRCALIAENLQRLKLDACVIAADAAQPEQWWQQHCDAKLFDRILLDAPCSATGVIRHHPDIKLLRKEKDIAVLAETQLQLLHALWPLLKPQGCLLYVTCSILPQENDEVTGRFLAAVSDAQCDVIETEWGIQMAYGKQLLPEENGHDGFYFCRIKKLVT
jgi:16S rRNA (cytosine967-C5)-methyltransferase